MGGIRDWVIGIVGFILIMSVISHLINGKKFLKYIKFFMGLILILIVLSPAGKLFSIEEIYNDILNVCTGELEISELKTELTAGLSEYSDSIIAAYKDTIKETIKGIASEQGYEVAEIEADINVDEESKDYGVISSLKVFLSEEENTDEIKVDKIKIGEEAVNAVSQVGEYIYDELKQRIAGRFNLDSENVDIFVTEE